MQCKTSVEGFITFELVHLREKYDNLTSYHLTIISRPLQAVIAHFLLTKYLPQRGTPEFKALAESPDHSRRVARHKHIAQP
jgi:hypothetical protein